MPEPSVTLTQNVGDANFTATADGVDAQEMILIPAGSFPMGCDRNNPATTICITLEVPLHSVNLGAYYIDKYEVTNARYKSCQDAGV